MADIGAFLDELGLAKYLPVFETHEVEMPDVPHLTEDDLKEMGLPLGPRRRILAARETLDNIPLMPHGGPAPAPRSGKIEAERRQLTVMFVDLVGSTTLSERLDPEDLGELIRRFKETCTTSVGRFGGHVASFMGDGAMIYFGYPHAQEDAATRAIHAGLDILDGLGRIEGDQPLRARIGISTGLVVVGTIHGAGLKEHDVVMGETPNLAARLQSLADPDTLVISPSTRRLIGNAFELEDKGWFSLKGFSEKVQVWTVTGLARIERRFQTRPEAGESRLVGRWTEFRKLRDKWHEAQQGAGQAVMISGEAGIGKSRLIEGLSRDLQGQAHLRLSFQCSPYHSSSALYPVIQHLELAAGFAPSDSDAERLEKLARLMRGQPDDGLHLIADLLHIPTEDRFAPLDLTPQQRLEKTLSALSAQLASMARQKPVLILFEDAHWVDPTTLSLMDRVIDQIVESRVLVVMTYRPGFDPGWGPRHNALHLPLTRLTNRHVAEIVAEVAHGKTVPAEVCELIASKTDGIPLYVQEVTRGLLESGQLRETAEGYALKGPLPALSVPSTLQDSLMERLDRLGTAKEVAQTGAVFGRQFTLSLLTSVSLLAPATLEAGLAQLASAGIILQGAADGDEFMFRHALIRDMAYDSMLKTERQVLHDRAAEALLESQPQLEQTQPEILAHHYTMANNAEQAVRHWQSAGRLAVERSATTEAVTHLTTALDMLAGLPQSEERDRREIDIQLLRAGVLRSTVGIAGDATGEAYSRLRQLCGRIGGTERLFPVLNGLYAFHLVRAEYPLAHEVAAQILTLADQSGRTEHRMVGHRAMGAVLLHIGDLMQAREHLEQALELYDFDEHGRLAYVYGTDHAAITAAFLGKCLCLMGDPERAIQVQLKALDGAERLKHAHSVAQVLTYHCMVLMLVRDVDAALQAVARLERVSEEHSFAFMSMTARFWRCWAEATRAPDATRIAALREAAESWWSSGAGNYKPFFKTLIAEALLAAGGIHAAKTVLDEADHFAEATEEGWACAEQLRVQAMLAEQQGRDPEPIMLEAIAQARESQAALFELRATVALARHRKARGESVDELLRPMLERVRGASDLTDAAEARALFETTS
ncbi:guanylate cyclase [Ruegeria marisrubri]|uniref:Guanylate cyclase n=1 Tax=Ruegeria marisrubri TaxID=1685379 RepID=A0A0X3TCG3_9RHOB|nr:adenylate/guanylate cyclase domain-containing protein [Ruegeria marisrubri]KUJ73472.1 guanylate cyclase [Ruegeria marisrubri]